MYSLEGERLMQRLLAILCPPLAVYRTRHPAKAATNAGLTLLLYIPGLIHALFAVEKDKIERRNETLMRLSEKYYA
jgi:uncharacterized membrane protein YqaE (UPF0057 family)